MPQLKIRKDTDDGIVEIDTGDGWRGLAPDPARQFAEQYEAEIEAGREPDTPQSRQFISLLREYADDVEGV